MLEVNRHERIWRVALLALSLFAMAGPWGFDVIHVPAEYECTPAIRLEGDVCGVPLSGFWFLTSMVEVLITLMVTLMTDPTSWLEWIRDGRFMGPGLLLFAGPLLSALSLIARSGWRGWRALHFVAWALGGGLSLVMATNGFEQMVPGLWGLWLYFGLAAVALGLDVWGGCIRLRTKATVAS
jgi:hypothetical protein